MVPMPFLSKHLRRLQDLVVYQIKDVEVLRVSFILHSGMSLRVVLVGLVGVLCVLLWIKVV